MAVRLEETLFWYRPQCFCYVNHFVLMLTRCIYMTKAAGSPPALLPFKGQVTKQPTVKWSIWMRVCIAHWLLYLLNTVKIILLSSCWILPARELQKKINSPYANLKINDRYFKTDNTDYRRTALACYCTITCSRCEISDCTISVKSPMT